MKKDLAKVLVCPVCKAGLELKILEEEGGEIASGNLCCASCKTDYPIEDGIPNMLPPDFRGED
jgi:uncharacterized protein